MTRILELARELAFWGALALAAVAVAAGAVEQLGYSLIGRTYSAGRLLEFAAIIMVFAIGMHLRDILAELRRTGR